MTPKNPYDSQNFLMTPKKPLWLPKFRPQCLKEHVEYGNANITKLGEKTVRNKSVVAFSGIFTPIAAEKNILSRAYVRENPLFVSYDLYGYLFNIFVLRKPIQLS